MKLLLTSNGIKNQILVQTFFQLIDNNASARRVAFIPTAGLIYDSDKRWLVEAMHNFAVNAPWMSFDVVDLAGLTPQMAYDRLSKSDVLVAWGGNEHFLAYALEHSGIAGRLRELLEDRVWIGASAGSSVLGGDIPAKVLEQVYGEATPEEYRSSRFLEIIEPAIFSHYESPDYPGASDESLEGQVEFLGRKAYAIDDNSALLISGQQIEVISAGKWRLFGG